MSKDDEAPTTNRSKQTNFPQVFKSKLKLVLDVPAKKFKEIVKINIDPHKIPDNFGLIKKYLEECLSHHTHQCFAEFSYFKEVL